MMVNYFNSERLLLREPEQRDEASLLRHLNFSVMIGNRCIDDYEEKIKLSVEDIKDVINKWKSDKTSNTFLIILRKSGEVIGHTNFIFRWDSHCPDLEVVIYPDYRKNGFGFEISKLMMKYIYENTMAHNISVWIDEENIQAIKLSEKLGMKKVGRSRREVFRNNKFFDNLIFDILRPEWEDLNKEIN